MKKLGILAFSSVALLSIAAPFMALAQTPTIVLPPTGQGGPITGGADVIALVNQVLFWVATLFWIGAVIFIFLAAFGYLTAAGDPEKVKNASHRLLYAVIAVAVGLMAYGIPTLVNNFLRGK